MPEDKAAANKREAEYAEGQKVWPRAYHAVHPATPRLRAHSSHQPVPAALG